MPLNIIVARSVADGNLWMQRLHADPVIWRVVGCVSIPDSLQGHRPDAIFVTPSALHWLAGASDGWWHDRLSERGPVFTIQD